MNLFDRDEILRLFEDLSEELDARGTRAEVQFLLEEFFGRQD
jgi:hypothetical protein